MMDNKEEFKVEFKDGKYNFIARTEVITHPDGRQDVIVHAPSLELMSKYIDEHKGD